MINVVVNGITKKQNIEMVTHLNIGRTIEMLTRSFHFTNENNSLTKLSLYFNDKNHCPEPIYTRCKT